MGYPAGCQCTCPYTDDACCRRGGSSRGCCCGKQIDLQTKLDTFDKHSREAACFVVSWLAEHSDDLIAVARGRHVLGHYRYQEKGLFEYDTDALLAEAAEEIADAIVYTARRLALLHDVDGSADPG